MSIVCIGDSLTFGYGVDETENWISILSTKIEEKIINKGISGNTTIEMKERFIEDIVKYKPSKVLIMGGTNDIFLNFRISNILDNIDGMVEICKKNNSVPIILTPLPVKDDIIEKSWFEDMDYKEVNKNLIELRNLLIQYGKKKTLSCIDLGNILLKDGKIKGQFLEDGIHVSKAIHKKIANIIYNSNILN